MELAERIRSSVRRGDYGPGERIGSEHELARRENLARMTVRRTSEVLINEGLIERRPGKGLFVRESHVTTRMVQVVTGNLQWEPSAQVSRGVQSFARTQGIQVQLYDAQGSDDHDLTFVRQLPDTQARGAIILALHSAAFNEAVFSLRQRAFPFVLVDQCLQDIEVPSVTADNYGGGYQVGRALLDAKHRRIAFIGDLVATTVRDRLAGLRDAVAEAGIPFDRSLVMDIDAQKDRLGDWSERIDRCTRDVMNRPTPPTAIFFSCDAVARTAYRTLATLGLSIPRDVAVVGFDDDPLAEWLTPPLATVRQPFFDMGRVAMELLIRQMVDDNTTVERRQLPVQWIPRASLIPAHPPATV